jgi:hypothetical protein
MPPNPGHEQSVWRPERSRAHKQFLRIWWVASRELRAPSKLFTASASIVFREAGVLLPEAHRDLVKGVVKVLESGLH